MENAHWVSAETAIDVCRKIESGEIDLWPKISKEEIEELEITLEIIK